MKEFPDLRQEMIKKVKEAAEDILKNAENIVDENIDHVSDFDIWIHLEHNALTSYEVTKEYVVIPDEH